MTSGTQVRLRAVPTVLLLVAVLTGCTSQPAKTGDPEAAVSADSPSTQTAERFMQVTDVHDATGMTLLEGPTFGPDGSLYVVDVTAPPGAGKVLKVDTEAKTVETVFTDNRSALTSAQFSPSDGRLYVTDFLSGSIRSMTADGRDTREEFSGPVDGKPMQPDDIAFDKDGNLFITDAAGARDPHWDATGRIVRVDGASAKATVLAEGLESPNGVSFSPDFSALWVSLNTANRVDHLTLSEEDADVSTAFPAIYVSAGEAQVDSIAVDMAGNLYVGLHNRPTILVYDTVGRHVTTIKVPAEDEDGLSSATNVAIKPGSTRAYVTISGTSGGFLYTFDALASGIRQSSG